MLFGASRNSGRRLFGYTLLLSIAVLGSFLLPAPRAAAINEQLNFQGRLFNAQGATVPDGLYNIQFKIYEGGTGTVVDNPGGTLVWTENHLNSNSQGILVKNGYLSVELGEITAFGSSIDWDNNTIWLSMNIGSTNLSCTPFANCAPDGEMIPMKRMTASPYAMNAARLGGFTSADFIQNQNSAVQTGANLWMGGTARIDTAVLAPTLDTATATTLNIGTTNATSISLNEDTTLAAGKSLTLAGGATGTRPASPTAGMLYYDTTSNQLLQYNGTKWVSDRSTATKIVAASNSSQYLKDSADYVADGTDDQVEINAALNAAAGGKVYLAEGTYATHQTNNGDATIFIPNSTTLAGSGRNTLIQLGDIDASDNLIQNTDSTTGTGVSIQNLRIDGQKSLNTSGAQHGIYLNNMGDGTGATARNGAKIVNIWANNFTGNGLFLNSSDHNTLADNTSQGNNGVGFYLSSSLHNTLTSNISQGNYGTGFTLYSSSTNNALTGNISEGNNIAGFSLSFYSDSNTLTGNVSRGNGYGFYLTSFVSNNIIASNTVYNSGGVSANNGIYFDASDSNSITSNNIVDTSATTTNYAININNSSETNYLADNRFSSTPGTAIINDTGTGTVYANQPRAENGAKLTNRTANDTEAFTVQNASGANVLTVDTWNAEIELGNASLAGKLVISDGANSTVTISLGTITGDNNYTLTIPSALAGNDTFCFETLANCTASAADFIQNQDTAAQVGANFWIDGTGKAAGGLQSPSLDTIAAGTLSVGTATATGVTIGRAAGTITLASNTTTIGTAGGSFSLQGASQTTADAIGNTFTVQGATGNGTGNGGQLVLVGGNGGATSGANGGNVVISGGTGTGTGTKGLVNMGATAFSSATNAACAVDCTIAQTYVDSNSTIIISSTGTDVVITLPAPTNGTQGRLTYITTSNTSNDFTLSANSGVDLLSVTMRKNTTATMVWNGNAWTPGGASNAITLQATYNNATNPATTPEIKLDSIRGTIDIQDADTSIGTDLLNVRGSNPSGLGTVLFGVSNTGRVTIQGTTDQSSAFRVLNSTGDYLLNVNSSNNYIINNSIRSAGNEIQNPGFESGGAISSGEEGWFGPSQATIQNSASNANSGNYALQVLPNGTNIDVYAGSYFEVNPGDDLYFGGYIKNTAGTTGTGGVQITWYDKDKAVLSSSTDYASLPGTSYVLRDVNATAPANTVYARVSAAVRSTASSGTYYFDDFIMTQSSQSINYTYRNAENSTAAFRIQSAGSSQTLFTANTTDNILKVGDSTGTDTATTLLVLDSATADPTTLSGRNGGIFYRSDNNSLKAVIGGAVVDICTTAVTCTGYSASAGSSVQLQGTTPGTAQTGNFNITGTGIMTQLQTQDNSSGSTQNLIVRTGNATGGNSGSLTLDVGTATGTTGTITIGHAGVTTTMAGTLKVQGSNTLELGSSSTNNGSILFRTSAGSNTVTLQGPTSNPTSSYVLTLPTNLGAAGECIKTDATGSMYFQGCGVGLSVDLQDVYDNSGTPANIDLADGKDFKITATDTSTTDPNVLIDLACVNSCGTNGRFSIQNGGTDVFTVLPNSGGIILNKYTQIGSATTDNTQVNLQLDSYNGTADSGACSTTVNQGAIYYNTSMGSLRSCINGSWSDVSNPDTLGLLTFGIVPSSGGSNNAYDLPSLITTGSSGPCKVSWASNNSVYIQSCVAYSSGRRVNVASTTLYTNAATTNNTSLTTTNRYGHICLTGSNNTPAFTATAGGANALANLPTFSATSPVLCLATVVGSATTAGLIDDIYDVRTFTSAMKEAVNASTALELGMIADAGTTGAMTPAVSASQKLYGAVVATDGATSAGAPNAIVTTVGPAWVKANAGTAGQFVKTSTTPGFANTIAAIPNNSFYYSVGNTRTVWSTTCTAANNCAGSLYINLIVR